jgi:hypothetical protein
MRTFSTEMLKPCVVELKTASTAMTKIKKDPGL